MAARYDLLKRYGGADRLREMAAKSSGVKTEIEAELTALKGIHPERCTVSKEYADALKRALVV